MKLNKILSISFGGFIVIGALLFFNQVKAVEDSVAGLIISPPLKEKTINPGETYSDKIKVENPTKGDLKIDISVQDFRARGEEGGQEFLEAESGSENSSLSQWLAIENSFNLKPGENKEISYKIATPKGAEPGGHFAAVFFTPTVLNPTQLSGSGVVAIPKIGSLILVTVAGQMNYDAKIAEFASNKKLYLNTTNLVDLISRFQNLGNVHVKPAGNIIIKNALGKQVVSLTVNENKGNVLPDSIRKFTNQWSKKYGFGWYKAEVNLSYGNNQNVSAGLMFFIIPWKETAGGLIILMLVIWFLSRFKLEKKK